MDVDRVGPLRKTLGATLVVALLLGVVASVMYALGGYPGGALRSVALALGSAAMFGVVVRARSFRIIGHVMAAMYAIIVFSTVLERGPATLLLPSLAILPLLTTFTSGRRAGWLWAGITTAIALSAWLIEPVLIEDPTLAAMAVASVTVGLIATSVMLASAFARSEKLSRTDIRRAYAELAERNRLLSRAVTDLERARAEADAARAEAVAASRAKSVFLTAMSHEVRTPLNGVVGLAALLSEAELSPDDAELVAQIRHSGELLADLLGDVLDLSALEAGEVPLRKAPFDPREPLRQVIAGFAPLARERGVVLALDVAGHMPTVQGDASRVRQVLAHLVGNALKYTREGRVLLRLRCDPASGDTVVLRIDVSDTGCGMDVDVLGRVFEAFRQGSEGLDRTHGGTGLGLALCRGLAQAMHGDLAVQSTPGEGSTFSLHLELPELTSLPDDELPPLRAGLQVAVIEDEPINRRVLQSILEKAGCVVHVAEDGAEGLELIRRVAPALVLSDVQMPALDGNEMTRILRTEGVLIPIIAVTANALSADRAACLEAGMNDVLTKPVHPAALVQTLSRWTAATDLSDASLRRLAGPGNGKP